MIEKCPDLKYIRTDIEIKHAQFEKNKITIIIKKSCKTIYSKKL
jgi:hypothetical protein